MQRTLFFIPHEAFGIPVFGWGWALGLLGIAFVIWLVLGSRGSEPSVAGLLQQHGVVWVVAAAVIVFLIPAIEIESVGGDPVGVAVRGYGVFLLCGVASGIALALWRAPRAGISGDHIFSLALWMFIGGIGGARLFYIIEYRDAFMGESWGQTLRRMIDFTRGGLVVYGSIIGGTLAIIGYSMYRRVSTLRLCDVIIPSLFIGLFFGRMGCLMNGCCYGGRCAEMPYALHFPPGSPVYLEQIETGDLLGIEFVPRDQDPAVGDWEATGFPRTIQTVRKASPAARQGVRAGQVVSDLRAVRPPDSQIDPRTPVDAMDPMNVVATIDGQPLIWSADQLPEQALPVHPSQLISSLSGLVICGLLLAISALCRLPVGALTGLGFALYALARFGEEMVRTDEPGQFGTQLSISQWISLVVFPAALVLIFYSYWYRPGASAGKSSV